MIFLRPWYLLFLLVPVFFFFISGKREGVSSGWKKACDPELLPYLLKNIEGSENRFLKKYLTLLWCILSIAMAGPTLSKMPVKTATPSQGIVVVLDMSPAMDKQMLFQTTLKLKDLLKQNKDPVGFVLTDEKAYTVVPVAKDNKIMENTLNELSEKVMPSVGSAPEKGILKAQELLKNADYAQGKILLITGGVSENFKMPETEYPVWVLGMGEREPHPVLLPNGQFWLKSDKKPLQFSLNPNNFTGKETYLYQTLDDNDIQSFLKTPVYGEISEQEQEIDTSFDFGGIIVALCLPFFIPLFRRGVLIGLFLLLFIPHSAEAIPFKRGEQLFFEKNKQAEQAFEKGDYKTAENLFTETQNYYNLGNTQAYMGKYQEAIQSYEKALSENPENQDAQFNLNYLKEALKQKQNQEKNQKQQQNQQNQEQQEKQQQNEQSQENEQQLDKNSEAEQQQSENEQQNTDKQQNQTEEQKNADKNTDENAFENTDENQEKTNLNNTETTAENMEDEPPVSEEISAENMEDETEGEPLSEEEKWLKKIQKNNGRILRYRLKKQYMEQQ
ncbi:MAG: tetratricopeptide repeat protein [Alphaproteobacteria bacterium]|nr:tetratricopeptide repeat protein [Alphaproteobacteria bacterium]